MSKPSIDKVGKDERGDTKMKPELLSDNDKRKTMKASDTVLESLPFLPLSDLFPMNNTRKVEELYSRLYRTGVMVAEAQAEVSFMAGIKEVVKWLQKNCKYQLEAGVNGRELATFVIDDWRTKLISWGIDETSSSS